MQRSRVTILDLVSRRRSPRLLGRLVDTNNIGSIMPQVVAAWCEELGHQVHYICYAGPEDVGGSVLDETDILFISSFTRTAQIAYAISNLYRRRGAVTALGGPHARCYPQDAAQYFDYVLGLTDREVIEEVLRDGAPYRPHGRQLGAVRQPEALPGVKQRWRFIESASAKSPLFSTVPMIGSLGCPYSCSFCIDASVPYQPLSFRQVTEDLRFLLTKRRRPRVAWLDPNFGVRFEDYMSAIETAVPSGRIGFIAESSLSLLSEPHLKRLRSNGFDALLPGIESWYTLGNKSKTGSNVGADKVRQVADHVNMILRYVPYVQANFVLGLDCDEGAEPFELTKRFVDLAPGAYPAFSLLTAYGQAAPINLELQRAGRVVPFPFRFLDGKHAMNVRPKNYAWSEFYDHVVSLTEYAHGWPRARRRARANRNLGAKMVNLVRAAAGQGGYQARVRDLLYGDADARRFFDGVSRDLPRFFEKRVRSSLGPLWSWLPPTAVMHDELAYSKSTDAALGLQKGSP